MTPSARRRDVVLLFGALGTFFLSISMLLPTLPLYIRDLGGSPVDVGIVTGIFSIGVLVVRPWVGKAVDTRGRRPVLLLGSLLAAAMAPFYIGFTAISFLIAIRIVHGIGLSAFTGASTTLVTDLAPPERRTEFLGYLSTSSILAFALGPLLGIEIAERLGYPALFTAFGLFALASAGLGARLSKPPPCEDPDQPVDYRAAIVRRQVLVPTVTLLLVTLAHGGAFTFLPILLEARLPFNFGLFFLAYAGASLLIRLAAGGLSRRWGDGPMVWGGLATYAVGMALLPLITGMGSMLASALLFGLGFGAFQPAVYGLVANAASDRTRGMVFSVFLGAFDLGIALGGLVAGLVVARFGIPELLYGLSVVPLAAAALFVATLGWRPDPTACAVPAEVTVPS
ncbi:MAG TPA: MFS transporter [Gemmatimonadota bacterium]|nr:MFS transporter [Gemmatimonadota bacterium]